VRLFWLDGTLSALRREEQENARPLFEKNMRLSHPLQDTGKITMKLRSLAAVAGTSAI
jgi:hypothetical protein